MFVLGGLAAEKPGWKAEGGPGGRGPFAEEEACGNLGLHPGPPQEHALEAARRPGKHATPISVSCPSESVSYQFPALFS